MLRECIYGECAHEQHVRRTLTLTHTITAYSVSGNVVRVRILICATRQKPCRKRVIYPNCHRSNDAIVDLSVCRPRPRHKKFIDPHMVADADRSATSKQRRVVVQREFVGLTLQV